MLVTQLCLILCDPMDSSLPGSSWHWILQARILEWIAISLSRESSQHRDWTPVFCIVGGMFTIWAPGKPRKKWHRELNWISVFSLSWVTSGKRHAKPLHSKQQNIADRHEFRDIPLLWVRRLNINRITIFPRLMYRFSIIPIKIPEKIFFLIHVDTNSKNLN